MTTSELSTQCQPIFWQTVYVQKVYFVLTFSLKPGVTFLKA